MAIEQVPEPLEEFASQIAGSIDSLQKLLAVETPIPVESFNQLVGNFTRFLNLILKKYPDLPETEKDGARPHILYWRQLQAYLVFLLRFPEILQVPHHAESVQALNFIKQREKLLRELYVPLAQQEKNLFSGSFRQQLEECLAKRVEPSIK